jgi:ribonucleoside-diphosphate reductase alpha chain
LEVQENKKQLKYMDKSLKILSDLTVFSKYAKYNQKTKKRESFNEIVSRYQNMMIDKFPDLELEIINNSQYIRDYKVLPSMRMMQFAGKAIEVNHARGYNCSYLLVDSYHAFSETMFLLLGGSGVGYSVQNKHIDKLPEIHKPTKERKFLVQDDIMGWADAIKILVKSYFGLGSKPKFDFRAIREKGALLVTAGGKAPGAEPLKICLAHIEAILENKPNGSKLTSTECHDIMCHIADSVLSGGIRRAAMIALFDFDDEDMITSKYGTWYELNPQRGRANNSAVAFRPKLDKKEFLQLWKRIELSGSGEPGIYLTNNPEWGTNPCVEIALRPFQFCNLCELNVSSIESEEDFQKRVKVASFFGTLQASFTDFHYLRDIWKKTTEKDALLGIGMTGIASNKVENYLKEGVKIAMSENERVAEIIGIKKAARVTCVKPSGTTSCVLGTSSGIHTWHSPYYLRTMRFNKTETVAKYLMENHPEICEDEFYTPKTTLCVRIPIKAPKDALTRNDESPIDFLERVKHYYNNWVKPGHRNGINTHNISATISVKEDEWEKVGEWMWDNKNTYNGLSVLPYDGGSYIQAPFEEITEEKYNELILKLKDIDFSSITEEEDNTTQADELACSGANCEVK